jgi:hypothetical protein
MTFIKYKVEYKGITYPCCCQTSKDIVQAVLKFNPTEWEVKELCNRKNCIERNEPMNYNELVGYIERKRRFVNHLKKDIANYYLNTIKERLLQRAKQYTELDFDDKYINDKLRTTHIEHESKTTAKEAALAYILDLYVRSERIPINEIEGGYNKKILTEIGKIKGFSSDTFYRAVKDIDTNFDINALADLNNISFRWEKVVMELSEYPNKLKEYLIHKQLIQR